MQIDESVLLRYFTNALNVQEQEVVEQWVNHSQENKALAEEIYYIYFISEASRYKNSLDPQMALERIKQVNIRPKTTFWSWAQRIAAILFIPLLIGTIFHFTRQETVQYMETHVSPGMICAVDLPDGSKVWLNSDSYLKYPRTFSGKTRNVYLKGEAYFSVKKDKKRFIVETEGVSAEVLGTEFNMDAYPNCPFISTTLVNGSIILNYKGAGKAEQSFAMVPEQKVVYNKKKMSLSQKKTYVPNVVAWREGKIILRDTPLEDVLWILSKRYNVDFNVEQESFKDYSFTGTFSDQQLSVILDHFNVASHIRYRTEDPEMTSCGEMKKPQITLY
jgi:ferric-dicitrate binding protein FerR (iron transport regulator)